MLAAQYPVLRGWAWVAVANRAASTLTVIALFALGVQLHGTGEISVGASRKFRRLRAHDDRAHGAAGGLHLGAVLPGSGARELLRGAWTRSGHLHELPDATALRNVRGAVAFEGVTFGYEAAHPVLHELSFSVEPGSMVAVVGPTGAGKTTALSLLYRAYDPGDGRITIDGVDIRSVTLDSLRAHIAVVFQNPGLLYRSIADNLRIGKPDASDAELEAAALAAEAHHFVVGSRRAMPHSSPRTASRCPAGSDSACRSPAPCSRTPRS